MIGLTVLSSIISLLPRIVLLFEKREAGGVPSAPLAKDAGEKPKPPEVSLSDMAQTAVAYAPLIEQLPQPFELRALYVLSQQQGYPHVHLTLTSLRDAGFLVPEGDGLFSWNPDGGATAESPPLPETPEVAPAAAQPAPEVRPAAEAQPEKPAPAPPAAATPAVPSSGTALVAPMPGMIVRYAKQKGDAVSEGETVVILEAMKMENALPAPVSGTITAVNFASGDAVAKAAVLCLIE